MVQFFSKVSASGLDRLAPDWMRMALVIECDRHTGMRRNLDKKCMLSCREEQMDEVLLNTMN